MLQIENLTKVYPKGVHANDGVNLQVDAGQVFGLLGHNGAGKTTLLNQVIGLTKPTAGTIRINGRDAVADPAMARRSCSLQPQTHAPLEGLTPRQAIELMARIRGANRARARRRATELLSALDLNAWADTIAGRLSGGVRRLTAFCMAAAEPGTVIMLDEPTNDVDPVRRRLLWRQIQALADDGLSVVLVTHNVVEAERAVEHLVILDAGRVVASGTPAKLRGELGDRLRLEITACDGAAAARLVAELAGGHPRTGPFRAVETPVVDGRRAIFAITTGMAPEALAWAQHEQATGRVEAFQVTPVSLEDVYLRQVQSREEGDDAGLVA